MHNPFSGWPITGSWADHMSYSLGGTDYPLDYGTPLPAPAAGTLHTKGRPGPGDEYQCGQVGSAGRRSILMLDQPVGPMVAIVFQHQSRFGVDGKHYDEGEDCGWSGASANGDDRGGETHLHIHGLDAKGNRLDFTIYAHGSSVAAIHAALLNQEQDDTDMISTETLYEKTHRFDQFGPEFVHHSKSVDGSQYVANVQTADDKIIPISSTAELDAILDNYGIPYDSYINLKPGETWSRARVVEAKLDLLLAK